MALLSFLVLLWPFWLCEGTDPSSCHDCNAVEAATGPTNNQLQIKCKEGYFFNSKKNKCQFCTQFNDTGEVYKTKRNCSNDQDADFVCESKMHYLFIDTGKNCGCTVRCEPCSICGVGAKERLRYEKRSCEGYLDTLCCHNEDDVVINGICTTIDGENPEKPGETPEQPGLLEGPGNGNIPLLPSVLSITTFTIFHLTSW